MAHLLALRVPAARNVQILGSYDKLWRFRYFLEFRNARTYTWAVQYHMIHGMEGKPLELGSGVVVGVSGTYRIGGGYQFLPLSDNFPPIRAATLTWFSWGLAGERWVWTVNPERNSRYFFSVTLC